MPICGMVLLKKLQLKAVRATPAPICLLRRGFALG